MLAFFESFLDFKSKGTEGIDGRTISSTTNWSLGEGAFEFLNPENLEFLVIVHGTTDRVKVVSKSFTHIRDCSNEFSVDI
ncbi:hypothetical protein JTB14_023847 [Gonioctena quinquepunctata]|nr:hypothetical protein JTB14_023847 [Gonioctena quinquepunctata]